MFRGSANAGLAFLAKAVERKAEEQARYRSTNGNPANGSASGTNGWTTTPHSPTIDLPLSDDSDSESSTAPTFSTVSTHTEEVVAGTKVPIRVSATGHLPPFSHDGPHHRGAANMIRQRVSLKGHVRPLEPASELPGCQMRPEHIGRLHAIPVRKWLKKRADWDDRYAKDLAYWREVKTADRIKAEQTGFLVGQFVGERPPLGSIAGWSDSDLARKAASSVDEAVGKKTSASMALAMWANISNRPDEAVVEHAEEQEHDEANGDSGGFLDRIRSRRKSEAVERPDVERAPNS